MVGQDNDKTRSLFPRNDKNSYKQLVKNDGMFSKDTSFTLKRGALSFSAWCIKAIWYFDKDFNCQGNISENWDIAINKWFRKNWHQGTFGQGVCCMFYSIMESTVIV